MRKKLNRWKKKFEYTAIAVTYAEVGEWEIAENYLEKIELLNKSGKPKMIVVTVDSEFSEATAEYSVSLADRMHYDLLAVNATQPGRIRKFFGLHEKGDIKANLKRIFSALVERAQKSKVRCETIMITSDLQTQIKKLISRIRRVELVLIQSDRGQQFSLELGIPVFQIEANPGQSP